MLNSSDNAEGAVGAEKSPRKVGWFIFGVFVVLVLALGVVLLAFRHHAPVPQSGGDTHSSGLMAFPQRPSGNHIAREA